MDLTIMLNGKVKKKSIDLYEMNKKIDERKKEISQDESDNQIEIITFGSYDIVSHKSYGRYFEYYNYNTFYTRLTRLTTSKGTFNISRQSYEREISASEPQAGFEMLAGMFKSYLLDNNTLINNDFIPELFENAGFYYPGLDASDHDDIVDIYEIYVEEGYDEATSTIKSAIITAIVNKFGNGYVSTTASFVNAGFTIAEQPAIIANFHNMNNMYDAFKSAN